MALSAGTDSNSTWSSGTTFVLAAIGAAVGLGNIWKFPYVVGVSGGGAFVLVYVLCVALIAIPILIGELLIGRLGSKSPPVAMADVAERSGRSRSWGVVGWMGMIVGYLIATFYSVIAGWTLAYIFKAATGFGGASPRRSPRSSTRCWTAPQRSPPGTRCSCSRPYSSLPAACRAASRKPSSS